MATRLRLRPAQRSRVVCALPVLALALAPVLRAAQPQLPVEKAAEIRRVAEAEIAERRVPGLSIAVANDFRVVWAEGFGIADLEHSVACSAKTVFRLASLSKPITAVAAMQLVENGKLDLDAPIQKYVPSFPEKQWPVTPRVLLNHTSGIRHYGASAEIGSTRHYSDTTEPLKIFADSPLLFEPGERFSYTTYGYNLLGAAVEGASGMRFVDYLRERVFGPAGMLNTRQDNVYDIVPHRSRGYRKTTAGVIENCELADTSNKIPGGGLLSTPEDIARFVIAVERGVLLKEETVERMFTAGTTRDGKRAPYGLGWGIDERDGKKTVLHTGSQQGVSTIVVSIPSQGFAVAAMANLEGVHLGPLCGRIAEIVLR